MLPFKGLLSELLKALLLVGQLSPTEFLGIVGHDILFVLAHSIQIQLYVTPDV
jgi:hypothetical protein